RAGSTPTAPMAAAGSARDHGPTRSSTTRRPASAGSTRTRRSGVPGMRRAGDLHAAVPERHRLEARRRPDTAPARLDAAAPGQPAGPGHTPDPVPDADIAPQVEGVATGLQVEDSRDRRRSGRVGRGSQ